MVSKFLESASWKARSWVGLSTTSSRTSDFAPSSAHMYSLCLGAERRRNEEMGRYITT